MVQGMIRDVPGVEELTDRIIAEAGHIIRTRLAGAASSAGA